MVGEALKSAVGGGPEKVGEAAIVGRRPGIVDCVVASVRCVIARDVGKR
jgi:hypothetical protein